MRNYWLNASVICLLGCWWLEPPPSQECSSDLDCKGDRVCEDGSCVSPEDGGDWTEPDGGYSDDGGQGLACGEVAVPCNCGTPPDAGAAPGFVSGNPDCESGSHAYDVCDYCPNGAYAWYTY